MSDEQNGISPAQPRRRLARLTIVLAGIILGQAILYGPSLIGQKILLPLDILAKSGVYLPQTPEVQRIVTQDMTLTDLIYLVEPTRRFVTSEIHAGRFPLWENYQYAGAPLVWPIYSPFLLFESCTSSPVIIAWGQLLMATVAGLGAYLFSRRVLQVGFWPGTVFAWCYPLTGFFIFWQNYPLCACVPWLPWLLWAVDFTLRRGGAFAVPGLSVATWLTLVSGNLDIAGQMLLISGLFALWHLCNSGCSRYGLIGNKIGLLAAGWGLGLLLAAPYVLPTVEYGKASMRLERRAAGLEERAPAGPAVLPLVVAPDCYGTSQEGSFPLAPKGLGNQLESPAAGYAGLVATLLLAPLAWCSRRHRTLNIFWCLLAFLGLGWSLNLPGVVDLLRLPGFNMMSHNRLVFATAFAILALAVVGLDVVSRGQTRWHHGFWVPVGLLLLLFIWSTLNVWRVPLRIDAIIETLMNEARQAGGIYEPPDLRPIHAWFFRALIKVDILCALALLGWIVLRIKRCRPTWLFSLFGFFMVGDLIWFASGRNLQCDPALYFPRIPVLQDIARSAPGRVLGFGCLPASLLHFHGLKDICGYDGADPKRLVELVISSADPCMQSQVASYALVGSLIPSISLDFPGRLILPPVLNMLNVRYVVFQGDTPPDFRPVFQRTGYWVLTNSAVLPRAYIPRRVVTVTNDIQQKLMVTGLAFDPQAVACVPEPVGLPADCRGSAEIVSEVPNRVTVSADMETPGLVVLADTWDKGWRATLNGKPVPILRANHAIRGVVVPAESTLEFRYLPRSFVLGVWLALSAVVVLAVWLGFASWRGKSVPTKA